MEFYSFQQEETLDETLESEKELALFDFEEEELEL
mgnify:FL=1